MQDVVYSKDDVVLWCSVQCHTLIDNVTFMKQDDLIKEIVDIWRRLEEVNDIE